MERISGAARHKVQTPLLRAAACHVPAREGVHPVGDLPRGGRKSDRLAANSERGRVLTLAARLGVGTVGVVGGGGGGGSDW